MTLACFECFASQSIRPVVSVRVYRRGGSSLASARNGNVMTLTTVDTIV